MADQAGRAAAAFVGAVGARPGLGGRTGGRRAAGVAHQPVLAGDVPRRAGWFISDGIHYTWYGYAQRARLIGVFRRCQRQDRYGEAGEKLKPARLVLSFCSALLLRGRPRWPVTETSGA